MNWGALLFYMAAVFLSMFAQSQVQKSYNKYNKIHTVKGQSGAEVARSILAREGITDVTVVKLSKGILSDNFNPGNKTVSLSPMVYEDATIASVAVAAHEVGHAIQYHQGYKFIAFRNAILPMAIASSKFSVMMLTVGLLLDWVGLFWVGIILFSVTALFQLLTLPLEFDASKRALTILSRDHYVDGAEYAGAKKMLTAAAMTYVMALVTTIAQILQYVMVMNSRRDRRR